LLPTFPAFLHRRQQLQQQQQHQQQDEEEKTTDTSGEHDDHHDDGCHIIAIIDAAARCVLYPSMPSNTYKSG
jgi:hypothetical protein